ncbi:GDYXXLXY domain-containing protein [Arenibacter sp. 6A1]|uniref:GDYXXLXY domain-containing protein n=1 Tax=Arenibacter sp. 6A1 TaxID=2720391 RepID=UPI001446A85A|nr:GDYXXLXY domain-containing protein [Arenibacter sp. 6A1]NKI27607.1 GDYXXLXY domain-containing protein [Arenibacter sp. 6A1]
MKKYRWILILVNLIIILGVFNYSVFQKEELLSNGQLILLELAPVDPRSLMQGDYMSLRYAITNSINSDSISKTGFCIVTLEDNGVAKMARIQEHKTPRYDKEYLIGYTSKQGRGIHIGAESYFFQEGEADKYENAKYGGIKIDHHGRSLLIGLFDENLKKIE